MAKRHSAAASRSRSFARAAPVAPLISLQRSSPMILTSSSPSDWARCTAWNVRESNLDRFLDARHGSTIEEFWTQDYIDNIQGSREYCETLLKYIIMFNHEEVGGHAVMFINEMLMWDPKYFPEAMMNYCTLEKLFEPDQIAQYGRKFLEKVIEWCHIAYKTNQQYWDNIFNNPPEGKAREDFVASIQAHHTPQKLKEMNIIPAGRPDDWPSNYFALARNKTAIPTAQNDEETVQLKHQNREDSSPDVPKKKHQASQLKAANKNTDINGTHNDAANSSTGPQTTSNANESNSTTVKYNSTSFGGNVNGGKELGIEDKRRNSCDPKLPVSPQSKKSVSQQEDVSKAMVLTANLHRRSISEPESQNKHPKDKDLSWMTATGVQRRSVSDEKQSKQLENAMHAQGAHPNRVPNAGRGGAQAAIGRYQYRSGADAPAFTHPYAPDTYVQNNAAYLYHQDHNFGRTHPPQPDHSTTYRPGSNIYRTDPLTGAMFLPVRHPQTHYSQAPMYTGTHNQMRGYLQQHAPIQMSIGMHASQAPHNEQASYPHPMIASPQVVQAAPHGIVPNHTMAPYIQLAAQGVMPQSEPHLSRVGQLPRVQGYPPMRHPSQFVARATSGQAFSPQQVHSPAQTSSRPGMQQQIVSVRGGAQVTTPHLGQRNIRRDNMRSVPISYSPNTPTFHPGGALRPSVHGLVSIPASVNVPAFIANENHSPGKRSSRKMHRHTSGSGSALPFPSYMDDMLDPSNLPESQQCTSTTIGPDAEDVVTLWFADIPPDSTVKQLKACITKKMSIAEIRDPITYSMDQQYNKGWTFVKFLSNKDAREALDVFQGHPFNGSHLKVQVPERRTQSAGRPRKSSSLHCHHQAQSSDNADAYVVFRGSSGGGGTPGRPQPFPHGSLGASPGPRRPRGSSLVQANQAVRRNSAFSKQDARSDLPLPDLPEVSEQSPTATSVPPEHTSAMHDDYHVHAVKKPGKKKLKLKKRKVKDSRDTSTAPSETTVAEFSSLSRGSPTIDPVNEADLALVLEATTYASIVTDQHVIDAVLQDSETNDVLVPTGAEHAAPASIVEGDAVKVEGNINPEPEDVASLISDKADIPQVIDQAGSIIAESEVQIEDDSFVDLVSMIEKQAAPELGGGDAATSVAGMSDMQSEGTTIVQDRPVAAPAKEVKSKTKGPAQTQSLSAFAIAKTQKKLEQARAKKARKRDASRKVSKASSSAAVVKISDDGRTDLPENKDSHSSLSATEKKECIHIDFQDKMQCTISESSSMGGTPKTAQEYPDSVPGTPTPRLSAGTSASQTIQTPSKDEMTEKTNPGEGGTTTTRRRSTIVGGEFPTPPDQEGDSKLDESRVQPTSQVSGQASGPQLKKENSKPKTWAEAAKGVKTTAVVSDTGLGLVERNVNVQR